MAKNIFTVNRQWRNRPADERFVSLLDLQDHCNTIRSVSKQAVVSSHRLTIEAGSDKANDLVIVGQNGTGAELTNWSFGQLATLAGAPAGYLRNLPAVLAAENLNFGLRVNRDAEDVGVLLTRNETGLPTLRAATGPNYGRIWNSEIVNNLVHRFGDGITGNWRVPGEFGRKVEITKDNSTIYGSDRDVFIFLADEDRRIEIPNRRNGAPGSFARGFYVWNSEVGAATFGIATFLFDYVCCNRIIWGVEEFKETRIRHTASAPDKWLNRIAPMLKKYQHSSASPIQAQITAAQEQNISNLDTFLSSRFPKKVVADIRSAYMADENRPMETIFDVVTGVTAYARSIENQSDRIEYERKAGDILDLVR